MIIRTFVGRRDARITIVKHNFDQRTAERIVICFSNTNAVVSAEDEFRIPTFMAGKLDKFVAQVVGA